VGSFKPPNQNLRPGTIADNTGLCKMNKLHRDIFEPVGLWNHCSAKHAQNLSPTLNIYSSVQSDRPTYSKTKSNIRRFVRGHGYNAKFKCASMLSPYFVDYSTLRSSDLSETKQLCMVIATWRWSVLLRYCEMFLNAIMSWQEWKRLVFRNFF